MANQPRNNHSDSIVVLAALLCAVMALGGWVMEVMHG
jgi:hypothetical protein